MAVKALVAGEPFDKLRVRDLQEAALVISRRRQTRRPRRIAALLGALALLYVGASVRAQPPAQAADAGVHVTPPDRSSHVTIDAVTIDDAAITALLSGMYTALGMTTPKQDFDALASGEKAAKPAKLIYTVSKDAAALPKDVRYTYFAGRDAGSGREIVWESDAKGDEDDGDCLQAEYIAAYALAALDGGVMGEPWRTLYARRTDDASRRELARSIAIAFAQLSHEKQQRSTADAVWIKKTVVVGMTRDDAYSALRAYGVVAFNNEFNPPVSIGTGRFTGCKAGQGAAGLWPYHGEVIPKWTGSCAQFAPGSPDPFPTAYVKLDGGFDLSCSGDTLVTIDFDQSDRVKKLDIKMEEGCL